MQDEGPIQVRPRGRGFAAEGRGFYVWDQDRGEVLRVARELEQRHRGVAVRRGVPRAGAGSARPGRLADPEALDA
jgi:hypothetical protein